MCNVMGQYYHWEMQYLKLTNIIIGLVLILCALRSICDSEPIYCQLLHLLLENVRPTFCVHRLLKLRVSS